MVPSKRSRHDVVYLKTVGGRLGQLLVGDDHECGFASAAGGPYPFGGCRSGLGSTVEFVLAWGGVCQGSALAGVGTDFTGGNQSLASAIQSLAAYVGFEGAEAPVHLHVAAVGRGLQAQVLAFARPALGGPGHSAMGLEDPLDRLEVQVPAAFDDFRRCTRLCQAGFGERPLIGDSAASDTLDSVVY